MPQKILIIGATSGIGREMAEQYLAEGCLVGITGRRQHLLDEVKANYGNQVYTTCFSVTDPKCLDFLLQLVSDMGGMDLLIYNAGYGEVSKDLDAGIEWNTVSTNVTGFVKLVSYAFQYFIQKGSGQIAVISSIAALRGNSWAPAYSASKAFISNYAEGLNIKAKKLLKDIVVTDVKPGFIDTKMAKGNKRFWVMPPAKAAAQIRAAIKKKKRKVYITRRWWLVAQIMKVLPYSLYKRLG